MIHLCNIYERQNFTNGELISNCWALGIGVGGKGGGYACKRKTRRTLVVLELFIILTVMVGISTHVGDKILWNLMHTHTHTQMNTSTTGDI